MPTKNKVSETKEGKTTKTRTFSSVNSKNNANVVVKKRKEPLKPTKASAAAITFQANRAKKQALLEKFSNESIENVRAKEQASKRSTRIPLWVWIFFGCSLFLFCISFYKAVIYPKLDVEVVKDDLLITGNVEKSDEESVDNVEITEKYGFNNELESAEYDGNSYLVADETEQEIVIKKFFEYLSNQDFDGMMTTVDGSVKKSSVIQEHFTEFRMIPFLGGIEGNKLLPENINYVSSSAAGKETYKFKLFYTISSTHDTYDEDWEMIVDKIGDEWKIVRIDCVTAGCSKHPIFWPEKVGLM